MKILIVEDNPLMLRSLVRIFDKLGYETYAAIDGMQAIEFYRENNPEIVITDLMLPFVTGQEFIEFIRLHERSYTMIVGLSAFSGQDTIQHMFELGVDEFVTKPFFPTDLVHRVKRLQKYSVLQKN